MRFSNKYLRAIIVSAFLGFLSVNTYAISDEPAIHCDPAKGCKPKVDGKHAISDEPAFQCGTKRRCNPNQVDEKPTVNTRAVANPKTNEY